MAERVALTAVYQPVEDGWTQARLEELPGAITAAPSPEEAKEMLVDALHEYLLSLAQDAEPLPLGPGARRESLQLHLSS